jgi:hypothetical protein
MAFLFIGLLVSSGAIFRPGITLLIDWSRIVHFNVIGRDKRLSAWGRWFAYPPILLTSTT